MASSNFISQGPLTRLCNIITPIGMLGYGLDQGLLEEALEECAPTGVPTAIILDSGSTDGGPACLALGVMTCPRLNYKRDLEKILEAGHRFDVPVLISSAGGDGSDEHVEEILKICEEIAEAPGNDAYNFKTIAIFAGIPKALVSQRFENGAISGCGPAVPPISQANIDDCPRILGQMGPEPFVQAMEAVPNFDLVVGGRAYDPAPYVAFANFCLRRRVSNSEGIITSQVLGGFMQMGKIMECGASCAIPKSAPAMAILYLNGTFDIRPLSPGSKCTPLSVAAHTLYEKARPDILHGPGGYLDVKDSKYEQLEDGKTVRVRGARFFTSEAQGVPYQIKLEAAKATGFRTMYMGSMKDPILIGQLDDFLGRVTSYVQYQQRGVQESWKIDFHTYKGGSSGSNIEKGAVAEEVFLIGEALAETQALATAVADTARIATIHGPYPGQKATSGNFAFGVCGIKNIELGPCAEFCIYHLMSLEPGEELGVEIPVKSGSNPQAKPDGVAGLFRWQRRNVGKGIPESREVRPKISHTARHKNSLNGIPKELTDLLSTRPRPSPSSHLVLGDVASVLRSKNAGPFEITLDVMFETEEVYRAIKESSVLDQNLIENLYELGPGEVIWCGWFDQARAFKATIPRKRFARPAASGGFMENDVHGSQQYIPLFLVPVPAKVAGRSIKADDSPRDVNP